MECSGGTKTTFDLNSFDEDKIALISLINQTKSELNIDSHVLCPTIFDMASSSDKNNQGIGVLEWHTAHILEEEIQFG
jgi:hypothetical protein